MVEEHLSESVLVVVLDFGYGRCGILIPHNKDDLEFLVQRSNL